MELTADDRRALSRIRLVLCGGDPDRGIHLLVQRSASRRDHVWLNCDCPGCARAPGHPGGYHRSARRLASARAALTFPSTWTCVPRPKRIGSIQDVAATFRKGTPGTPHCWM